MFNRTTIGWVLVAALLAACGSGGSPVLPTPTPNPEPPPPGDGPALYVVAGCDGCHGDDGSSGFAVDIACYPADGLDAYLRTEDTPHAGGRQADFVEADFVALADYLLHDDCSGGAPTSHTAVRGGVSHRAGDAASCAPCHGPANAGFGSVPSCASCHGGSGALTCTGCHATAVDNGDGVPASGRRGVVAEFAATSHHAGADVTDADCAVCHDMSRHQQGVVRLWNVDYPGNLDEVVALAGDPRSDVDEAAKLETFCLACHDADGADGSAPFSDMETPTAVDATAFSNSSHAGAALTCIGDGTTFGCHGSGHGTPKRMLLAASDASDSGVTGDTTREEEGFCYGCHTDGGTATSDIEAEFTRTHRHKVGSHDQGDDIELECTSCHDPHLARTTALLCDPDDGGVWTGTMQAFCITCHDGDAPDGVSFPTTTTGTGYDKSAFVGTTHATALGSDSCADCHEPHGSAYEELLFDDYVVADSNERSSGDYGACWDCHSASTILESDNAFDEYHKKHVIDEDLTCAECHDVHGGTDSAEPGLINFALAFDQEWNISFPSSSTTLSSAFWLNASKSQGFCAITCHGEGHSGENYAR